MKKVLVAGVALMASFVVLSAQAAVSPLYMQKLSQFKATQCLNYTGNVTQVTMTYTNCSCFVGGNAIRPSLFESNPDIIVTNPNMCN